MKKFGNLGKIVRSLAVLFLTAAFVISCTGRQELSEDEFANVDVAGVNEVLRQTRQNFLPNAPLMQDIFERNAPTGGTFNDFTNADPRTFNFVTASSDNTTSTMMGWLARPLSSYDTLLGTSVPRAATWEIFLDETTNPVSGRIVYTLRDDLYWDYYNNSRPRVKITSDDYVFWYNEITGNPEFQHIAYSSRFIDMPDGSRQAVTIEKINDRQFAFNLPRVSWDPSWNTTLSPGPRHLYEPVLRAGGVEAVKNFHTIDTDPRTIPSFGPYFIAEYTPGMRIVYERNPNFYGNTDKDVYPYFHERLIDIIIPEENTRQLSFLNGDIDIYSIRPEDVVSMVEGQTRDGSKNGYTVLNNGGEGDFGTMLWTFNQNPIHADKPWYDWFTKKEFRQAMSSLINRDRIIDQVFRGLARPKMHFLSTMHPYRNDAIYNRYDYNPQRAIALLASIGITRDAQGVMRDSQGRAIEFNYAIIANQAVASDTATIIAQEAADIGITINIRPTDFQLMVTQLQTTFDWESLTIGMGSPNLPGQAPNVWMSNGNFHMWHPYQESPATEWEARVDYLHTTGRFTLDPVLSQAIWDEYTQIILEQTPVIYLYSTIAFAGFQNRWDHRNYFFEPRATGFAAYTYLRQ